MAIGILKAILDGRVVFTSNEIYVDNLPWQAHPVFPGVALKHLITGKDTEGKFSSHLVRVNGGCEIGNWWFLYPLGGWGIGVLVHGFSTFAYGNFGADWEERKIKEYMEKDREKR